eukprot:scaffold77921_cov27-Phaeocystis_antarctica.AAC.1
MRNTCPHATGHRVKAGAARRAEKCPPSDEDGARPRARIQSGPSNARRRGASYRHPPSCLSPAHSPGRSRPHCRARNDMTATQRRCGRQRQRCQPELISGARAWGW